MPPHSTEISSPARFVALPGLMHQLLSQAQALGLAARQLPHLQLIVEELFSNTITHGYGQECDQPVDVMLRSNGTGLTLIYQDWASPFDLSLMRSSDPVANQIGGLGVNLILGLAHAIRYQRGAGFNRTEIDL